MPLHHLMIGTWTRPGAIFTVQFDDEAKTLELVKRTEIPYDEPISWMTFSHDRKTIYGASMKKFSSHAVESPTVINYQNSLPVAGHPKAADDDTNTRAIFVLAAKQPPYHVYGNPFYNYAGCGNVFSVDERGRLKSNIQNYEYDSTSGVHGMVFDVAEEYLYSADMYSNCVWTHKKDSESGLLVKVGKVDAPEPGDHPRWVELHPNGRYLYVLNEAGNTLALYEVDPETHLPIFTHTSYPLILPDLEKKMYRADVVFLSHSKKYLFATSRANSHSLTGFISAFSINVDGSIDRQICLSPTPNSGGHSNAVSPCPWTDEWLALTDDQDGWVEIYRWHNESLKRIAHLDIKEPGFGMNAIWYD